MTRLVETINEVERFLEEFRSVTEQSNIDDIQKELQDKDDSYFLNHSLVIHVSRLESSDLSVQVNNIIYEEQNVLVELGYTYVGTHLRQKNNPVAWITIIGLLKSNIAGKKILVKDKLETYYIDEELENIKVYTYYSGLSNKQKQEYWHIQNPSQMDSAMQVIRDKFTDDTNRYGGIEQIMWQIDLTCQDIVVALIGNPTGLMEEFSEVEAYKIKMDGIIDIEMGCASNHNRKQRDTVGIVVMPFAKEEICNQKVIVDFR